MPIFNDTLLTEKGYEAANKAANGQYSFTLTRAVASPRDYRELSTVAMRQLTSLDNESAGKIAAQDNVDSKKTKITTKFSNEIEPKGYMANTVGIYAKGDDDKEFLYSVTPSSVGQVIPEQNNNIFSGFSLAIYVIVGNVQNMKVELSPGGDASIDYVDRSVSQAKDDINAVLKLKMNRNADGTVPDSANFVNGVQKNGVDVPNMDDLNKVFGGMNFVKDNKDGSVTANGKQYAVSIVHDGDVDFNTLILPGRHVLKANQSHINAPFNSNYDYTVDVIDEGNGNLGQLAYSSGISKPYFRYYWNSKWSSWIQYASVSDLSKQFDNITKVMRDYAVGDNHDDTIMVNGQRVNLTPTKFTNSEQDAIEQANSSNKPALFVYPTDASTTNAYKHVLGIYAFGTGGLRVIDLINANTSKYDFTNAYALYNETTKTVTLHGSIKAKASGNNNDSIFSFAIDNLNMNYITGSSINSQPMTVDTDAPLKNIVGKANANYNSGQTWNIEGATITLGYDASLKPKLPSYVPSDATVMPNLYDLNAIGIDPSNNHFNPKDNGIYFKPAGIHVLNAPSQLGDDTEYTVKIKYLVDAFKGAPNQLHGIEIIKYQKADGTFEYYVRDIDVYGGYTVQYNNLTNAVNNRKYSNLYWSLVTDLTNFTY